MIIAITYKKKPKRTIEKKYVKKLSIKKSTKNSNIITIPHVIYCEEEFNNYRFVEVDSFILYEKEESISQIEEFLRYSYDYIDLVKKIEGFYTKEVKKKCISCNHKRKYHANELLRFEKFDEFLAYVFYSFKYKYDVLNTSELFCHNEHEFIRFFYEYLLDYYEKINLSKAKKLCKACFMNLLNSPNLVDISISCFNIAEKNENVKKYRIRKQRLPNIVVEPINPINLNKMNKDKQSNIFDQLLNNNIKFEYTGDSDNIVDRLFDSSISKCDEQVTVDNTKTTNITNIQTFNTYNIISNNFNDKPIRNNSLNNIDDFEKWKHMAVNSFTEIEKLASLLISGIEMLAFKDNDLTEEKIDLVKNMLHNMIIHKIDEFKKCFSTILSTSYNQSKSVSKIITQFEEYNKIMKRNIDQLNSGVEKILPHYLSTHEHNNIKRISNNSIQLINNFNDYLINRKNNISRGDPIDNIYENNNLN